MSSHRIALAALLVAGCGNVSPTGSESAELSARYGIDYAWGRPAPGIIRADGYSFAARYLSDDTSGKNLSAGEADALRAAGVDVVVVWESGGSDALDGYATGAAQARAAEAQARACGQPEGRPIYFAVDFDASAAEEGAIGSYFDGVASVLGRERTGVYGGYYVVKRLFDAGKVKWGWQTYAWSGGQWDGRAQLRQILNGINVGGVDSDRDEAVAADFGQWGYKAAPPPPERVTPRLAVDANDNARLEVFRAAADGALDHDWQLSANGFDGWAGSHRLDGVAKTIAIAHDADGRLELFYVGSDEHIYHNFQNSPDGLWHGSVPLGGAARSLAVGYHEDGRIELFYLGTDAALYHNYQKSQNGDWSGELALGGKGKALTVGRNADGRLEIFYVGTNDRIYHNFQNAADAGWYGEVPLSGSAKDLAVGSNANGRLELFYIGTNDALYHNYQRKVGSDWSGEGALGGKARQIAVGNDADGALELFYVGTNDGIYHNFQDGPNGGWAGERRLEGAAREVAVARNADGRLELFYIGTNEALYHNWQLEKNGAWAGQSPLD